MTLAIRVTLAALVVAAVICLFFAWRAPAYANVVAGLNLVAGLTDTNKCHGIVGTASWYGSESGHRTATGEYFDGSGMTAAMPSRSMLGKRVRVTYKGRSVVVRINDIGPAKRLHRLIDLSRRAARELGIAGLGRVCIDGP